MKRPSEQQSVRQFSTLLAGLTTIFCLIVFSFGWFPLAVALTFPFLIGAVTYYIIYSMSEDQASAAINRFAKFLSILIVLSIVGCCWFAIQSLWISPSDTDINRFELENIAAILLAVSGFSTMILSALQRDTFWFSKRQRGKLDEREMNERRVIFEKSYRYSIALVALTLWGYLGWLDRLPVLREIDNIQGTHLPGHYFFPAYCLIIALVALPPVLATRRKR